ncbi:DNA/RNA nuclease SfsA [Corallincola platygyrae]|uniref:Sugar fermentation stimulation protein homolog n=1 Tax=Corallincola platygyrae TaxID=1193278 RepID=A0ABW4XPK3_9GAMM
MLFDPPLSSATLIKRYKRFLADITLSNGDQITVHCANTGAMTGCAGEGWPVYYSKSNNPKRKLPGSLELTVSPDSHLICVNTAMANKLVEEALSNGIITELSGYRGLKREVKYGQENSRIDFLLSEHDTAPDCYLEVKMVTLLEEGQGYFPDAVTTRGQKHLRELIEQVEQGYSAALLFCVTHTGIDSMKAAAHIDPAYAQLLGEAISAGVKVLAYGCDISEKEIKIDRPLPVG